MFVEVIGIPIKNISALWTHFNNHIAIFAFRALENIVFMHFVIGHEIANFHLVGADPQVQTIVFIELILQRESAHRASQVKEVYYLHIELITV
jgi:hypothetical protein